VECCKYCAKYEIINERALIASVIFTK
jgi:hypothetical protein